MDLQMATMRRNTLGDTFRKNARKFGDKTAITCYLPEKSGEEGEKITYREFNSAANRIARGLYDLGLQEGDTAAVFCHNCSQFLVIVAALLKANITATLINTAFLKKEFLYQMEHSEAKLVFVDDSLAELVADAGTEARVVAVNLNGNTVPEEWTSYEDLCSEKYSDDELETQVKGDDIAFRLYTSGTTSLPKGINLSHDSFKANCQSWANSNGLGISVGSTFGMFLPLYHSGIVAPLSTLCIGAHLVVGSMAQDLMGCLDIIEKEEVDFTGFPVTLFARLIDLPLIDKVRSVKTAIWFGGAMPLDVLKKWFDKIPDITLIAQWSQTECLVGTCVRINKNTEQPEYGSIIGVPFLDTEIKIVDNNDNELPDGEAGEIVMRSPAIMTNYHNNPKATAEAFKNGWHHTGDVAYRGKNGMYFFVDRLKDMIKTGGVNVAPIEVEQTISMIDGVVGTAVFGVYHPDWIEAVVATVVTEDKSITEADIIAHCKANLAKFKVPKKVLLIDQIPVTHIGKVSRKDLRETYKDLFTEK